MPDHAEFSPSSAHRWLKCPASISRSAGYEDTSGEAALKGTVYHAIADSAITAHLAAVGEGQTLPPARDLVQAAAGRVFTRPGTHDCEEELGELSKIGSKITVNDVYDKIQGYVEACIALAADPECVAVYTERRVHIPGVHGDCWGTADFTAVFPDHVTVLDLKTGNIEVSPVANPQLVLYGLGALYAMDKTDRREIDYLEVGIYQFDAPHYEVVPRKNWRPWVTTLAQAATDAQLPDPPAAVGGHCGWCPAKPGCGEYANRGLQTALEEFGGDNSLPALSQLTLETLDAPQTLKVIEAIHFFDKWKGEAEAIFIERMKLGFRVPGYKLIEGRKNKAWKDQDKVAISFAGVDGAFNEPKLRTPTQLIKALGAGTVDGLWETPKGAAKLVASSSKGKDWEDESVFSD